MNRRNVSIRTPIMVLISAALLAGCASTPSLFARYDQPCPRKEGVASTDMATVTGVVGQSDLDAWEPAVYYGFDKARMSNAEKGRLDRNLAVLKRRPHWQISVRAYTDRIGSPGYNRDLSERRLKNVVAYLRDHGLPGSRIKGAALGDAMPILPHADRDQRVINRRVELLPLDAAGRPLILRAGAGSDYHFAPPVPVK